MLNWTVYGSKGNRDSSVVSEIAVSVEKLPNTTWCANLREGKRGLKVGRKLGNGASFNSFLALENYFFLDRTSNWAKRGRGRKIENLHSTKNISRS